MDDGVVLDICNKNTHIYKGGTIAKAIIFYY